MARDILPVDENLFYKGIDKNLIEPARLSQHSLNEPPLRGEDEKEGDRASTANKPPYSFHSGESLLALTRKHNVSRFI